MKLPLDRARAAWTAAQGLGARSDAPLADVVARTGWIRTLAGAEAYLALSARAVGVTPDAVHAAVTAGDLQVLPSVRGCMYLVPRGDVAVSLQIAASLSERATARDLARAGVDDLELERVGAAVCDALSGGPVSTNGLRRALPDGVVRSLGEVGKKVGLSSTLPPALRRLELSGRISRRPVDGRLDHERYTWALTHVDPLDGARLDEPALHRALAERYFAWAGPATPDAFARWSGLGKRAARAAVKAADLVEVDVDGLGQAFATEAALDAPAPPATGVMLPALDNATALPQTTAGLVDPAHTDIPVHTFGSRPETRLGDTAQLYDRCVLQGGRIAGLWAWDPDAADLVVVPVGDLDLPDAERRAVHALLTTLGHGRRTQLDSDDRMRKVVARIRALG